MKTNSMVTAAAVLALSALSASAQIWVSGDGTATGSSGNTAFGYGFNVSTTFSILQLGAFDAGGDGLSSTTQVRLYQSDGGGGWNNVGGADAQGGTTSANYSWVPAPGGLLNLPAGNYILSVWYSGADAYGVSPPDGAPTFAAIPGLTFISTLVATPAGGGDDLPDQAFGSLVKGPNMNISVPEPETYALIAGLGLLGFGLYRRNQARG